MLAGLTSGGIIAIRSTVHPDTCTSRSRRQTSAQGVSVIDAPVSSGEPAVRPSTLLVWSAETAESSSASGDGATYADPIRAPGRCLAVARSLNPQPPVQRQPQRRHEVRSNSVRTGVPRQALCEVITRSSATSKALNSIAMFGGMDNLAPIAGALLQRTAATREPDRRCVSLHGAVFDAADAC